MLREIISTILREAVFIIKAMQLHVALMLVILAILTEIWGCFGGEP